MGAPGDAATTAPEALRGRGRKRAGMVRNDTAGRGARWSALRGGGACARGERFARPDRSGGRLRVDGARERSVGNAQR
jgi:hypothetical protein